MQCDNEVRKCISIPPRLPLPARGISIPITIKYIRRGFRLGEFEMRNPLGIKMYGTLELAGLTEWPDNVAFQSKLAELSPCGPEIIGQERTAFVPHGAKRGNVRHPHGGPIHSCAACYKVDSNLDPNIEHSRKVDLRYSFEKGQANLLPLVAVKSPKWFSTITVSEAQPRNNLPNKPDHETTRYEP